MTDSTTSRLLCERADAPCSKCEGHGCNDFASIKNIGNVVTQTESTQEIESVSRTENMSANEQREDLQSDMIEEAIPMSATENIVVNANVAGTASPHVEVQANPSQNVKDGEVSPSENVDEPAADTVSVQTQNEVTAEHKPIAQAENATANLTGYSSGTFNHALSVISLLLISIIIFFIF